MGRNDLRALARAVEPGFIYPPAGFRVVGERTVTVVVRDADGEILRQEEAAVDEEVRYEACPRCGKPTPAFGRDPAMSCGSCGWTRPCPRGCSTARPDGSVILHWWHGDDPCSWHDGPCEEAAANPALYCPCGRGAA